MVTSVARLWRNFAHLNKNATRMKNSYKKIEPRLSYKAGKI